MGDRIHLIPSALRRKVEAYNATDVRRDAPAVITKRDLGNMSGRVVLLRELSLPECNAAEDDALRRIGDGDNLAKFDIFRQTGRLFKSIVGVSDPGVHPDDFLTAKIHKVTEMDLEGAGMASPGHDGTGKSNGLAFAELFGAKDQAVLRAWDREHHSIAVDDVNDILGKAVPTADD